MGRKNTDCIPLYEEAIEKVRQAMPKEQSLDNLSVFFKVMGDGTRMRILWALDKEELCVADISVLLNMTKSAVSHQLCVLRKARLVRFRKDGKKVFYTLNDGHVRMILEMAVEHIEEE